MLWAYSVKNKFICVNSSFCQRHCIALGGHLASVHSPADHNKLQSLTASYGFPMTWIGGSDGANVCLWTTQYFKTFPQIHHLSLFKEGHWFWSDGTTFSYTYWCPGEPNNDSYQHCTAINYSGKWLILYCKAWAAWPNDWKLTEHKQWLQSGLCGGSSSSLTDCRCDCCVWFLQIINAGTICGVIGGAHQSVSEVADRELAAAVRSTSSDQFDTDSSLSTVRFIYNLKSDFSVAVTPHK